MTKRFYALITMIAMSAPALAQETTEDKINAALQPITSAIENIVFWSFSIGGQSIPFVLVWLIAGATFFTIYNRFVNIRCIGLSVNIVRGVYTDPNDKGEVSHFQALTTALSATVGLGNIAGVAIAISLGGPGATFWMIVAGVLGMSSKFVECSLGVMYRDIDHNGHVHGGPMYYLSKGLKEKGWGPLGAVLAAVFAVCCIGGSVGGGNMFQVNQAWQQTQGMLQQWGFIAENYDGGGLIYGIIMAILVGIVIIGGIKSIAKTTEKIVPFMCGIYVISALLILLFNITEIPATFGKIFSGAFSADAAFGGFVGVLIQGFRRAAFSNEAGIGSAAIAHSAVKTNEPLSEGLVALLEPFIDTVVVCTMTALVIIITGSYGDSSSDGIALTANAFSGVFPWFNVFLWVAVTLFAFSTMISWSYYGQQAWTYLCGLVMGPENAETNKIVEISYKVFFLVFVVIGASMSLGSVVGFSDAMIFAMCFPNVLGLYILAPTVKRELVSYTSRIASGEIKRHK